MNNKFIMSNTFTRKDCCKKKISVNKLLHHKKPIKLYLSNRGKKLL